MDSNNNTITPYKGYSVSNLAVTNFITKTNKKSLLSIGLNEDKSMSSEARTLAEKRGRDLRKHTSKIDRNDLRILYANMRSATKKLSNLDNQAFNMGADILIITETWYKETTDYRMNHYILKCNINRKNTLNRVGGVAIYVKKSLEAHFQAMHGSKFKKINEIEDAQICGITIGKKRIMGLYRSPSISEDQDERLVEQLNNFKFDDADIVVGDFNCPSISWIDLSTTNEMHMKHMNVFRSRGFTQYITSRTHEKDGILDLVYACGNETKNIFCKVIEELKLGSDHYPLVVDFDIKDTITEDGRTHQYRRILDPDNTSYENYEKEMDMEAEKIDKLNDVDGDQDVITIQISEAICRIYEKHVKTKLVEIPKFDEPSNALKRANNRMDQLRRKKTSTREEFEKASKQVKIEAEKDWAAKHKKKIKRILNNNKQTWKTIKEIKMDLNASQSKFYNKDKTLTSSDKEAADVLANYYANVAINVSPPVEYLNGNPEGWTNESFREVVERNRGRGMNERSKRTNHRLRTRYYDFNTTPMDFNLLQYPEVHWIAGDIPHNSEYKNYYGHDRPGLELLKSEKWLKENEKNYAIDGNTMTAKKIAELPLNQQIKYATRKMKRLGLMNIMENSEEEIIFPDEYPEWWSRSPLNKPHNEEGSSYYGYKTLTLKDLLLSKSAKQLLRNRLFCDGRTGTVRSSKELNLETKLKVTNRILKKNYHALYGYDKYLDYNEDLLKSHDYGWKERPVGNGRPILIRNDKRLQIPPPDWWIPGMASPHTARAIAEIKNKKLPKKEEEAELQILMEKLKITVDNGPMTYDQAKITEEILNKAVEKSNAASAPGFDNIFPNVIKKAGKAILGVLANLFNNCIIRGVFPKVLKIAWIKALPKKGGDPCDPKNTRPIAILPTIGKLFETSLGILEHKFTKTWNSGTKWSRALPKSQYGFKARSGCSDNLASSLHKIHHACDGGHGVTLTLFDFQKAFDSTTYNNMICDKINNGLAALVPIWTDYFKDRTFEVRIGEDRSEKNIFISGTPQGAPSSPNHFNQYIREINDIDGKEKITEEIAFGPEEICRSIRSYPVDEQDVEIQKNWSTEKKQNTKLFRPNRNKDFSREYFYNKGDTEGIKQSTRNANLLRHLKTDFYADDCKSLAITGAPPNKKHDSRTNFTYNRPLITFGCIQEKILEMEEFCRKRSMKFHPRKCQIAYFGRKKYLKEDCYMKDGEWEEKQNLISKLKELESIKGNSTDLRDQNEILKVKIMINANNSTGEKIKIEEAKLIRDLGVWYTVDGNGFLSTDHTFNRMICTARALSIAVKRTLRGAPLDRHVLCFHALIKAQFTFAVETYWRDNSNQRKELNKIYEEFFSDIEIPKEKDKIIMPEPLTSFLKKLCIKRAFRILKGLTATRAEDYWTVYGEDRAKIEAVKMKCETIHCWCKTTQKEFMNIRENKARADPEALSNFLETSILDEREGLMLRLAIIAGARENAKQLFEKKMAYIKERMQLKAKSDHHDNGQDSALVIERRTARIEELTRLIDSSTSGRIYKKLEVLNTPELVKKNLEVKMKTKNKDEYVLMIRRFREDYGIEDLDPEYEC